ncbi:MAG TPA: hypothetical protein VHN78_00640, partial [Chloroflexota bacterium]|nr:hypothetical protein [Chloroflexota bacterium]
GVVGITTAAGASSAFDLGRLGQVLTFGVESLRGEPYGSTVTAVTDATVLVIGAADLARLAAREPALAEAIRRKVGMPPAP